MNKEELAAEAQRAVEELIEVSGQVRFLLLAAAPVKLSAAK